MTLQAEAQALDEIREVVLSFVEGENEGVELRVNPPRTLVIGRSEECDIYLGEKKISRKHCEIKVTPTAVLVRDLGSTNGTYVNKKKITESPLTEEDRIQVGTTVIKLVLQREDRLVAKTLEQAVESPSKTEHEGAFRDESERAFELKMGEADPEESISHESPSGLMPVFDPNTPPFGKELPKAGAPLEHGHSQALETVVKSDFDAAPTPELEISHAQLDPSKPLAGTLSAMSLADLLQAFAQNFNSGELRIRAAQQGTITIVEGKIVAAQAGVSQGQKALYRMLGWNQGVFELRPLPKELNVEKISHRISQSVETLLMEGFRQLDELKKFDQSVPTPEKKLALKPTLDSPLSKLHPKVLDVLQLIINYGTFREVLDRSELSDLEATKIVYYLLKKHYIESS